MLTIAIANLFAQIKVSGSVFSDDGKPLNGATVFIKKPALMASTGVDGKYTITIPAGQANEVSYLLTATYVGYATVSKQVMLKLGNNVVDFVLTGNFLTLSGVNVTALKNEATPVMETPSSITVFNGRYLESIGANSISDFIQEAPGVSTTQLDEAYMTFQIRGISSLSGDSPAGYYLDDVPLTFITSPLVPDVEPFDLKQVEVLRGPQGTLYGNGGESGVVRVLTNDADPSQTELKLDVMGAVTQKGGPDYGAQGAFNLPLIKNKLAIRLTGGYIDRGGFLTNDELDRKNINPQKLSYFRGKINFLATDRLTIKASYWLQHDNVGTLALANDNFDHSTPFNEANYNVMNLFSATIEYKLPLVHFYNATSYSDFSAIQNDGSSIFALSGTTLGQRAFNEEFRANSVYTGPFNWLAGFYNWDGTFNESVNITYLLPNGSPLLTPYLDTRSTSTQYAGFGELYYKFFNKRLKAIVGLRYFSEQRDLQDLLPSTVALLQSLNIPAKRGTHYDTFPPRFDLAFNAAPNTLLYITAANGFRSGFVQSGAFFGSAVAFGVPAPEYVNKENLWSYEFGTKVTSSNKRYLLDASVYYNYWTSLIQATSQIVTINNLPTPIIYFLNTGRAAATGLDLTNQYTIPIGLTLTLGGNINNSEYLDNTPAAIGAKKGDRISFVPMYTLSTSAYYSHPVFNGYTGSVYADLQRSSERVDYNNGVEVHGDNITMLNMRIGASKRQWGIFLFGNNLVNDRGATYPSSALTYYTRLRPRTAGINLKFNFL